MKHHAKIFPPKAGMLWGMIFSAFLWQAPPVIAGVVYESKSEFFTSGDFNGDGILDVLVVDKSTGNARVGLQDAQSNLAWSKPLVTGVENSSGCAMGRFLTTSHDVVALTSDELNRVNLVDLSDTNAAGSPMVVTPLGIGAHSLAALPVPLGGSPPPFNFLLVASSLNAPPNERLDLLGISAGVSAPSGQYGETGSFERPNAFPLPAGGPTLAAGLVRGATNDALDIWQFTNAPGVLVTASNLLPGGDYAFGTFNGEALPRFLFYQAGQSNVSIQQLLQTNGGFVFGAALSVSFSNAVQQVFYTDLGTDGVFQINFGTSLQALSLPGGAASLSAIYPVTAGSTFTGVVPLGNGTFALLDAPIGSPLSVHASVVHYNGTNFTQISSGNLPAVTSSATRANVWLFNGEPFVSQSLQFIQSFAAPDWSINVTGLPGSDQVATESDGGPTTGLSATATTNNLGAPPATASFALVNQYNDVISVFSYGSPRPQEPGNVLISPPAGTYQGPISVSFTTLGANTAVFYSTSPTDAWHQFSAPFTLTYDTTVHFFGSNQVTSARTRLQAAAFVLGNSGPPAAPVVINPGGTNPPAINTNEIVLSSEGTLFYGRRAANNTGTLWCINLDGSGETYITSGARPRVSRDGKWLAFLRDGNPFANQGNLWVRNLATGSETLLVTNTNAIAHFDWDATGTNLYFDYNCHFYSVNLAGVTTQVTASPACDEFGPAVNPVNGNIAFFNLNPNLPGIFITTPAFISPTKVSGAVSGARWAEWSPDGQSLVFASGAAGISVDGGQDLFVVKSDGTSLNQITGIYDGVNGFPHGAVWSPDGDSLVAAGTIYGTSGIWVIPLTDDHTACDCAETLVPLPISSGDPVDFVGSMLSAPAVSVTNFPGLHIREDATMMVVYWSTNYQDYTLQSTLNLPSALSAWSGITGPYFITSGNFEYRIPLADLLTRQYFRLSLTGAMVVTPSQPALGLAYQPSTVTLTWPTNYLGYRLESTTNLTPPVTWTNLGGNFPVANFLFEYQETTITNTKTRFFRLVYP